MLASKELPECLRHILLEALGEERAAGSRIDDRGACLAQVRDRLVDNVDHRLVPFGEQAHVHVFPDDADPDAIEPGAGREARVRLRRFAPDAEGREGIPGVVAHHRCQHLRGILHRKANGLFAYGQRQVCIELGWIRGALSHRLPHAFVHRCPPSWSRRLHSVRIAGCRNTKVVERQWLAVLPVGVVIASETTRDCSHRRRTDQALSRVCP